MDFGNWEPTIHEDFEQKKRMANSQGIKSEKITFDLANEGAQIIGRDGSIYSVTLFNCTCHDFQSRQLPCKHMYRLAFEFGFLFNLPTVNRKAAKAFKDLIPEEIERYKKMYFDGAISLEKLNRIISALQSK